MQNLLVSQQQQQSQEQSVIRRINKEIQQELLNKESRIILIPPTNGNYHNLRAYYFVKEDYFRNQCQKITPQTLENFQSQTQEIQEDCNKSSSEFEKYVYSNCVFMINVIIPKNYPISNPRFKFPQQPIHPSLKNDAICCGTNCYFKNNWNSTQTIFTGIDLFCKSILNIPHVLKNKDSRIDLTHDCNFEIIRLINSQRQQFFDKCEKWAVQKGSLLNFENDEDFCRYYSRNTNNTLAIEIKQRLQNIKERHRVHQLILLEKNAQYFQSLSMSMIQQIIKLTSKPSYLQSIINQDNTQHENKIV